VQGIAAEVRFDRALARLAGVVKTTPLAPFPAGESCVELRLKLECEQEGRAFKARGAWNQVAALQEAGHRGEVVATSSGNHARALAWAGRRAGIQVRVFMPEDAYPNKIAACRKEGATLILCRDRQEAEAACAAAVARGAVLVHPYDAPRTVAGAGTVGLELLEQWPEVEAILVPVGGGGLVAGIALALHRSGRDDVRVLAVEPEGAPTLSAALAAGRPVAPPLRTRVQGLCPPAVGELNLRICRALGVPVRTLPDAAILAAQAALVRGTGLAIEAAGAAAPALALGGGLPSAWLAGRSSRNPLRVAAIVSGGNPEPEQLAALLPAGPGGC